MNRRHFMRSAIALLVGGTLTSESKLPAGSGKLPNKTLGVEWISSPKFAFHFVDEDPNEVFDLIDEIHPKIHNTSIHTAKRLTNTIYQEWVYKVTSVAQTLECDNYIISIQSPLHAVTFYDEPVEKISEFIKSQKWEVRSITIRNKKESTIFTIECAHDNVINVRQPKMDKEGVKQFIAGLKLEKPIDIQHPK